MNVIRGYSTRPDHPATSPYPLTNGVLFELRGGDVCDPYLDPDGWFGPLAPAFVLRFFLHPIVSAFIAVAYWYMMWNAGLALLALSPWALLLMLPILLVTLPFVPGQYIAIRFGRLGCYLGSKIYGVDSEAYKNFIDPNEVYPGSLALCFTVRFTTSLP